MEMTQTWIVFSIDEQQVYQIEYKGCTGQDTIDAYKTMVAGTYKVKETDIEVSFKDDLKTEDKMTLKTKITSSELVKEALEMLVQKENQN